MNNMAIIYTTIDSLQGAEMLACQALHQKLAACVNIIPQGKSLYIWDHAVQQSEECYLLFKTTAALLPSLEEWILANHPYDTPALLKIAAETSASFYNYLTTATLSSSKI